MDSDERAAVDTELERLRQTVESNIEAESLLRERLRTVRSRLAAATELLERWYRDYAKQSNLSRETKDFLASQPAAPTPTPENRPSSTEAEQRVLDLAEAGLRSLGVLDACKALDADWLRSCEFSRDIRIANFARAVLTQRGVKR